MYFCSAGYIGCTSFAGSLVGFMAAVRSNFIAEKAPTKSLSDHLICIMPMSFAVAISDGFALLCVISTGPHVDSIKFSGDLVAGLSLGTERTMVMTKDRNDGAPLTENRVVEYDSLPERYEFPLKRRSLYIMTGLWRYNYSHEITRAIEPAASTSRRISIIFRNEKHHDLMMRPKTVSVGM